MNGLTQRIRTHRVFMLVVILHGWWLLLSGSYLWSFWRSPMVSGADGSGHVAALYLYSLHTYPNIQGWLPEFFGGMPFPIFYPPLFYWIGATLMKLAGLSAPVSAKVLTIFSFLALPSVLFSLGRRFGLKNIEAFAASAFAGVIACGSNIPALSGIGLLGLFEVGLYTQTLSFVWFCVWCGALIQADRSRWAMLTALLALTATILTNVHMLPLVAIFGLSWFSIKTWRISREFPQSRRGKILSHVGRSVYLAGVPILIAAVWLIPLIRYYSYALGQPLAPAGLFSLFGSLNVAWAACALVAWQERHRRPDLAALCLALLVTVIITVTPLGGMLKSYPFQPWRIASGALLLASIPIAFLCLRSLGQLVGNQPRLIAACLAVALVLLALVHQQQRFNLAALSASDTAKLEKVKAAVRELPPGMVLVESFRDTSAAEGDEVSIRRGFFSRALTNQLAMDGRPVLWSIYREHVATAPLLTAVRNLFSESQGEFGMDGLALRLARFENVRTNDATRLATHVGVHYYLLSSPQQIDRLNNDPSVQLLWEVEGWHLFANRAQPEEHAELVATTPVLAWVPARFKSREASDLDLFNLAEQLAFTGHPDVCVLWAQSEGTNPLEITSQLSRTIVLIDPESVSTSKSSDWLASLTAQGSKLSVLLLDDRSPLAIQVHEQRQRFDSYERIMAKDYAMNRGELIAEVARRLVQYQSNSPASYQPSSANLWRTSTAYFPTWLTASGHQPWLTGQGGMASLDTAPPSLNWHPAALQPLGIIVSFIGIVLGLLGLIYFNFKYTAAEMAPARVDTKPARPIRIEEQPADRLS